MYIFTFFKNLLFFGIWDNLETVLSQKGIILEENENHTIFEGLSGLITTQITQYTLK